MSRKTRLKLITGKGGVGKSTISSLIASQLCEREKVLVIEVNGAHQIPALFCQGVEKGNQITVGSSHFDIITITPASALNDYALKVLRIDRLVRLIFDNPVVSTLTSNAPALPDALQLGKIYDVVSSNQWDTVIVDCPSTGHFLSLVTAAKTMIDVGKSGPLSKANRDVQDCIDHPMTEIVIVTTPEELPMRESKYLLTSLPLLQLRQCKRLIINKVEDPLIDGDLELSSLPSAPQAALESWREYEQSKFIRQHEWCNFAASLGLEVLTINQCFSWESLLMNRSQLRCFDE